MLKNLSTGTIGVKATLAEQLAYAKTYGFQSIDFSIGEAQQMANEHGVDAVRQLFASAGVLPGSWGFPVDFRRDEATWQRDLAALPKQAELAGQLGCLRTATWIMPCDNERDFRTNFNFHVARLRPAAQILQEHGIRLGLEFVGPKTLRTTRKYLFVYTLDGMMALCSALGTSNMGLLLDIFHLYTSHGTLDDVRMLSNADIVSVHVNDVPTGRAVDEQLDNQRALPGETGVLDLTGFLHSVRDLHYDGPVTAEPFSQRLRELAPEQAVAETAASLNKIWQQAGLE
jgi:sugar phosphate isomerase/epimerase